MRIKTEKGEKMSFMPVVVYFPPIITVIIVIVTALHQHNASTRNYRELLLKSFLCFQLRNLINFSSFINFNIFGIKFFLSFLHDFHLEGEISIAKFRPIFKSIKLDLDPVSFSNIYLTPFLSFHSKLIQACGRKKFS